MPQLSNAELTPSHKKMEKNASKSLFNRSTGQVLLVLITVNVLNLVIELIKLEDHSNIAITFKHGYFILNGGQVGLNIFSNISTFVVAVVILMAYNNKKISR